MSSDDESIDPFIDRLWYFDSVVSPGTYKPSSPPRLSPPKQTATSFLARESSLPLSTGGLSSSDLPTSLTEEPEYSPSSLNQSTATQEEDPQTKDVPRAFAANHGDELSRDDLYPWMKTLGLQYTADGMIQIEPSQDDWCGSGSLDFSTFLLKELLDKESKGAVDEQAVYSEPQLATQDDVLGQCNKDRNGLISPEELRKALANLGLLKNVKD